MDKLKKFLKCILYIPSFWLITLIPVSIGMLVVAFTGENVSAVIQYISYVLSAYTLTVSCIRLPFIVNKFKDFKKNNKYANRYFTDKAVRVKISLYISLIINIFYSIMQLYLAYTNESFWFVALSLYYFCLGFMRFFLLKQTRKGSLGKNLWMEYLHYRLCGVAMLVLNIAVGIMSAYIVIEGRGFEYNYILTIAMAAYTFFTFSKAVAGMVMNRRLKSPVVWASKQISFAAALVSVLSLETAMLTSFGNEDRKFNMIMTAFTSTAVFICVLVLSVYMIISSTKIIKEMRNNNE